MSSTPPSTARSMFRETGVALAVLALYVLTLLLPLHQSAGLQRDLNALGFSALDNWSVCESLVEDENGAPRDAAALTCPATGVSKHEFAALLPPALLLAPPSTAVVRRDAVTPVRLPADRPDHFGQSRAPPVSV